MPGTTDVAFILEQVAATQEHVGGAVRARLWLAGIGATGLAADAIYACSPTRWCSPQSTAPPWCRCFQSADPVFVAPQLLALFSLAVAWLGAALARAADDR